MARSTLTLNKTPLGNTEPAPAPVVEETAAPAPTLTEPVKYAPNPRNEALSRLVESANAETGNDSGSPLVEPADPVSEDEDDLPPDPVAPTPAEVLASNAEEEGIAAVVATTTPEPIKLKIKGEEIEVDQAEVLAAGKEAMQKKGAADRALREAAELLAQARAHVAPPAPREDPRIAEEQRLRQLAKAIQMGSDDDAVAALKELKGSIDPDAITNLVAEQVRTQVKVISDQDKAAEQLEALVPEILKDPFILQRVVMEERQARARGDQRSYGELYADIGRNVRTWIDGYKGPAPTAQPTAAPTVSETLQQRAAAKAATPAPVSGVAASAPAPSSNKPKTGSQILAEMRAARGQRQQTSRNF